MNQCSYIKPTGERCKLAAKGLDEVCWHHDPKNSAERVRTASRGGRGRVNKETKAVKQLMDELTQGVLANEVSPTKAHAVVALQNIKLRAIETERRLDEADVRQEFDDLKSVLREHGVLLAS